MLVAGCVSSMMHRFDVVAIRIKNVSRIVRGVILRMHLRGELALPSYCKRLCIKCVDCLSARADEGHVCIGRGMLPLVDLVDRKIVGTAHAEADAGGRFCQDRVSQGFQGSRIKGSAGLQVSNEQIDVINNHSADGHVWFLLSRADGHAPLATAFFQRGCPWSNTAKGRSVVHRSVLERLKEQQQRGCGRVCDSFPRNR